MGRIDGWLDLWASCRSEPAEAESIRLRILGDAYGGDTVMRILRELVSLRLARRNNEPLDDQIEALCEALDELEDNLDA